MSQLEKQIKDWVANDLISIDQAQNISNYEGQKPSNPWVLYGFLVLGASTIGIGIISLVAANWHDIPDAVKLFVDFLLLISIASSAFGAWKMNRPILFEVLVAFYMILCLASIGLISQIYHTGGKLYEALLLWSLITTGVASAAKRFFAPFIWAMGLLSGITFTAINSPVFQPLFHQQGAPVFMAIPLLSALLAIVYQKMGDGGVQTTALRTWTVISGMMALVAAESQLWQHGRVDLSLMAYLPGYAFALLLAMGIWLSFEYKKAQKILLLVTLGVFLIPFHLQLLEIQSNIASAVFSLLTLTTMAIYSASLKLHRLFQFFLVAVGIRFFVLYLQALGGLATTGFGLIITGLIIIAMVVAWNKFRRELNAWAERLFE